jgi:uncharacterized membrane protein
VKLSVLSIVGGILGALGILGYLQQAGAVYPTMIVTIVAVVLGIVWGIALPTLLTRMRVRKAART